MLADTDMIGLAAVITAFFGGLASLVAAISSTRTNRKVDTGNGITLGESMANVAAAVTTPPDTPPLGQLAADVHDTLNGNTGQHAVVPPA